MNEISLETFVGPVQEGKTRKGRKKHKEYTVRNTCHLISVEVKKLDRLIIMFCQTETEEFTSCLKAKRLCPE